MRPFSSIEVTRRSLCRPRRCTDADGEFRLAACCGCCTHQTGPGEPPVAQSSEAVDRCGQAEEAITILRRFLGTNRKPDLLDDTYLLLGAALYRAQQYGEALKYLQQLQTEFPSLKWPTVGS